MGQVLGGMLGLNGGAGGTGFAGPNQANIVNPTNQGQINTAYTNALNAMNGQNSLLNVLKGAQGVQNQEDVYRNFSNVAQGIGPNPAQAMLNNATGQNVANQAALMAGQRGAGSNVGLMARQAANQGANLQQQAVGQGANMQANQSMNALNNMGQMANTMTANEIGQTNANTNAQQNMYNSLTGAQAGVNNANVASQGNVNNANASMANTTMQGQQGFIGGLMNNAGSIAKFLGAEGGEVPDQSAYQGQSRFGSFLNSLQQAPAPEITGSPMAAGPNEGADAIKNGMKGLADLGGNKSMGAGSSMGASSGVSPIRSTMSAGSFMAEGGKVPAMLSPGERYLPPKEVKAVAKGEKSPMQAGEKIKGKPKVGGAKNSYANDVIPKTLEEGGIVLPRSVTQAKHPQWEAHKFVSAILAKKGKGLK